MEIDIRSRVAELRLQFEADKRQVEIATMISLTRTAQRVKDAELQEMARIFKSPTSYTMNSLYIRPATRNRLSAKVWLKDDMSKGTAAEKYLGPQIEGGKRGWKKFEKALISKKLMPAGKYAVPASGAKLDAHGNMDRGQIVQLLSYLSAFGEQGYRANMTDKGRARHAKKTNSVYFVGSPGGGRLPMGIWQRVMFARGSAVKPIVLFVDSPKYAKRFRFFEIAEATIKDWWPVEFERAMLERTGVVKR